MDDFKMDDYSTFNLFEDSGMSDDTQEDKNKRRAERCGVTIQFLNGKTGRIQCVISRCKIYSLCPTCAEERARRVEGELKKAVHNSKDAVIIKVSENILNGLPKEAYQRVPCRESGMASIVIDRSQVSSKKLLELINEIGQKPTNELLREIALEYSDMAGRRTSGRLMNSQSVVSEKQIEIEHGLPFEEYTRRQFEVDYRDSDFKASDMEEMVLAMTPDLNPQTVEELQAAVIQREEAFLSLVKEKIGEKAILILCEEVICIDINEINWRLEPSFKHYLRRKYPIQEIS